MNFGWDYATSSLFFPKIEKKGILNFNAQKTKYPT